MLQGGWTPGLRRARVLSAYSYQDAGPRIPNPTGEGDGLREVFTILSFFTHSLWDGHSGQSSHLGKQPLTRTENPASEASPPPLPLSLAVPQLISRHDTGSVFVLKISASEEKGLGSAVALRRKFLLSQQVTGIHHN